MCACTFWFTHSRLIADSHPGMNCVRLTGSRLTGSKMCGRYQYAWVWDVWDEAAAAASHSLAITTAVRRQAKTATGGKTDDVDVRMLPIRDVSISVRKNICINLCVKSLSTFMNMNPLDDAFLQLCTAHDLETRCCQMQSCVCGTRKRQIYTSRIGRRVPNGRCVR